MIMRSLSNDPRAIRQRERLKSDPLFSHRRKLRTQLNYYYKRKSDSPTSFTSIVGCTSSELRTHLESKFLDGMTWDNRKMWDIDHIVPVSTSEVDTIEKINELNHYSNLQVLWKIDNIKKGNR